MLRWLINYPTKSPEWGIPPKIKESHIASRIEGATEEEKNQLQVTQR